MKLRKVGLLCLALLATSVCFASADENRPKSASKPPLSLSPSEKIVTIDTSSNPHTFVITPNINAKSAQKVSWKSSDTTIAKVSQSGKVTPLKPGKVTISCTLPATPKPFTAACKLQINPLLPESLTISLAKSALTVGKSASLKAKITPKNAYDQSLQYKSSNPKVAKVSQSGKITPLKPGSVTIYAKTRAANKSASLSLTVLPAGKVRLFAIGQSQYLGDGKIPAAQKDVAMLANAFQNAVFNGKKPAVYTFSDLSGKSLRALFSALSSSYNIEKNDTTVIFYSGHGISGAPYNGALCGVDWDFLPVSRIRTYLDNVPGNIVLILDSCLSGQFIAAKSPQSPAAFNSDVLAAFSAPATKSLTQSPQKAKYKILTASAPLQSAYISLDRDLNCSVFSDFLAQALGEDFAKGKSSLLADKNSDAVVTLSELFSFVNARVNAYVARYPQAKQTTMVWPASDSFPVLARLP